MIFVPLSFGGLKVNKFLPQGFCHVNWLVALTPLFPSPRKAITHNSLVRNLLHHTENPNVRNKNFKPSLEEEEEEEQPNKF